MNPFTPPGGTLPYWLCRSVTHGHVITQDFTYTLELEAAGGEFIGVVHLPELLADAWRMPATVTVTLRQLIEGLYVELGESGLLLPVAF